MMSSAQVFLVLISGLGVLHGLLSALFLWFYSKPNRLSNRILSVLLMALSFRVGKSVFLEFTENLDIKFIFTGLAILMIIGPLFFFYTRSMIDAGFRFKFKYYLHFIPALFGIVFGIWLEDEHLNSIPKVIFIVLFLGYYMHYLIYLGMSFRLIAKNKRKSQENGTFPLLSLMFYALLIIWVAYVLNLFDESIPYIVGPILYTIVVYIITLVIIKKGYLRNANTAKYKTTAASKEQVDALYEGVLKLVVDEGQYKDGDLTLKSLSEQLHTTTQTLSMVINKRGKMNFNNFINHYRIEESVRMFGDNQYDHHTIAAIAFESGFNSISSFNTAFKKHTGKTPNDFRESLLK